MAASARTLAPRLPNCVSAQSKWHFKSIAVGVIFAGLVLCHFACLAASAMEPICHHGLVGGIVQSPPVQDKIMSIADKRRAFRALHQSGCFVIPNPWNVGSARYLQGLGFKALATTSAGFA